LVTKYGDQLQLRGRALGLLDGDDAVFADLGHRISNDLADGLAVTGDGGDGFHLFFGLDVNSYLAQVRDGRGDGLVDAALDEHGVGTGRDSAHAGFEHGLGQDGCGGRAVAGDVVGLGGHFLEQLGAQVLRVVFQLDLLSDHHPVLGDSRRAELLVEEYVAATRPERYPDGIGHKACAPFQGAPGLLIVEYSFGSHGLGFLLPSVVRWGSGCDGSARVDCLHPHHS
jgi:hypothetical protein